MERQMLISSLTDNKLDVVFLLLINKCFGEGNGNPLQYSCLEDSMDGGAYSGLQSMGSLRVRHD